jgi:formamidopyrimidine-DNA glycosylase
MPELPEVETIRRDLEQKIIDLKIVSVEVKDSKLGDPKRFARILLGNKIVEADRIGKLLIMHLADGKFLLIHLKMTGQLVYEDKEILAAGGHPFKEGDLLAEIGGELPNKYTRFILVFVGGRKLFFNDTRRFGYVKIVNNNQLSEIKAKFGIEPLRVNFTLANLKKVLAGRKVSIKSVLMDQQKIAGIGNIYASEILYAARVNPLRQAGSLNNIEVERIFEATEWILKKAVKHRGTTFSDYVDTNGQKGGFSKLLQVYERAGDKCSVCGGSIKKIKIAGRSTYFCPKCQK